MSWHRLMPAVCLAVVAVHAAWAEPPAAPGEKAAGADKAAHTDAYGDPLPAAAIARLGTVRWRTIAHFLAFMPDGRTIVTGEDRYGAVVRCWDVATGRESAGFRVPEVPVNSTGVFAVTPDGKTLALPQRGGAITLLSLPAGKQVKWLQGPRRSVRGLAFARDGKTLASAWTDKTIRLWDITSGREVARLLFPPPDQPVWMAFSANGQRLAVAAGQTLVVFDVYAGKKVLDAKAPDSDKLGLSSLSFSPDGKRLAWMGEGLAAFALWDPDSGKPVLQFRGHAGEVRSATFSPDGRRLASTGWFEEDVAAYIWDATTGQKSCELKIPCGATRAAAFSPDGHLLATVGGNVLRLWDVRTGQEVRQLGEHQGTVAATAFTAGGGAVLTGCLDGLVLRPR
jgi:WD40 repeat protein